MPTIQRVFLDELPGVDDNDEFPLAGKLAHAAETASALGASGCSAWVGTGASMSMTGSRGVRRTPAHMAAGTGAHGCRAAGWASSAEAEPTPCAPSPCRGFLPHAPRPHNAAARLTLLGSGLRGPQPPFRARRSPRRARSSAAASPTPSEQSAPVSPDQPPVAARGRPGRAPPRAVRAGLSQRGEVVPAAQRRAHKRRECGVGSGAQGVGRGPGEDPRDGRVHLRDRGVQVEHREQRRRRGHERGHGAHRFHHGQRQLMTLEASSGYSWIGVD
ncbi:hypothetical protein U9M48_004094 [Paspalum notatum var. saurae]|uniref:Uncharacterized protein n=1 Tax=Paspalum notatum var. saurae TaxID=547442 RepID=A0AAQ3SEK2_PASNO